jgi:hypothetical protein
MAIPIKEIIYLMMKLSRILIPIKDNKLILFSLPTDIFDISV